MVKYALQNMLEMQTKRMTEQNVFWHFCVKTSKLGVDTNENDEKVNKWLCPEAINTCLMLRLILAKHICVLFRGGSSIFPMGGGHPTQGAAFSWRGAAFSWRRGATAYFF